MNNKKRFAITCMLTILVIFAFFWVTNVISAVTGKHIFSSDEKDVKNFVKCLNEKNVKIYGVKGEKNTELQIAMFGEEGKNLNLIDCSIENDQCLGVVFFPSWEIKGRPVFGAMSLEVISRLSDCKL